jgi:hypothetical protein
MVLLLLAWFAAAYPPLAGLSGLLIILIALIALIAVEPAAMPNHGAGCAPDSGFPVPGEGRLYPFRLRMSPLSPSSRRTDHRATRPFISHPASTVRSSSGGAAFSGSMSTASAPHCCGCVARARWRWPAAVEIQTVLDIGGVRHTDHIE